MKRLMLIYCVMAILLLGCDKQDSNPSSASQNTANSKRDVFIKELISAIKTDSTDFMQLGEEKDTPAQCLHQLWAIEILGDIYAKEAAPELIKLLKRRPDYHTTHSLIYTLVKLEAKEAMPDIVNLFNDKDVASPNDILYAISVLGYDQVIPELIESIKAGDWRAAEAIIKINNKAYVPELMNMLNDKDANVRRTCASTLGYLGDKRAIPALIKLLKDEEDVKAAAVISLVKLEAKEAMPEIDNLLNGELYRLRQTINNVKNDMAKKNIDDIPSAEKLTELCRKSKLIFVGRIKMLVPTEYGYEVGYQTALYSKEEVLKGNWGEIYIPVNHLIAGGKTELHGFLNPARFYVGAKVIVLAGRSKPGWWPKIEYKEYKIETDEFVIPATFNEDYGVMPYSAKLEDMIKAVIDGSNVTIEPK
ncbi:MAG: HEAT repeat domain-containing protein [Planctomycetes bacterium]|nr:HEAT repeat domain-containing protein [Planctomycetota bacterium]